MPLASRTSSYFRPRPSASATLIDIKIMSHGGGARRMHDELRRFRWKGVLLSEVCGQCDEISKLSSVFAAVEVAFGQPWPVPFFFVLH